MALDKTLEFIGTKEDIAYLEEAFNKLPKDMLGFEHNNNKDRVMLEREGNAVFVYPKFPSKVRIACVPEGAKNTAATRYCLLFELGGINYQIYYKSKIEFAKKEVYKKHNSQ